MNFWIGVVLGILGVGLALIISFAGKAESKKSTWQLAAQFIALGAALAALVYIAANNADLIVGLNLSVRLSVAVALGVFGFILGVKALHRPKDRWFGIAVIVLTMVLVGGYGIAPWLRLEHAYENDRTVSQARSTVSGAQRKEKIEQWALVLNDMALLASGAKLLHDIGGAVPPEQAAAWSNTSCAPLRERCPYSSACMIGFGAAWSEVQGQTWQESADGFLRKSSGSAWVRIGHEPRGGDELLCLSDFGGTR